MKTRHRIRIRKRRKTRKRGGVMPEWKKKYMEDDRKIYLGRREELIKIRNEKVGELLGINNNRIDEIKKKNNKTDDEKKLLEDIKKIEKDTLYDYFVLYDDDNVRSWKGRSIYRDYTWKNYVETPFEQIYEREYDEKQNRNSQNAAKAKKIAEKKESYMTSTIGPNGYPVMSRFQQEY